MAAKKSTTKKQNQKQEEQKSNRQISAVILFAVAIFIFCVAIIPGGSGWFYLHQGICGVLGISSFILPVILAYIAIMASMEKSTISVKAKVWQGVILMALVSAAIEIFAVDIDDSFWNAIQYGFLQGSDLKNGGVLGTLIGYPVEYFLEDVGAKIVIILLAFVFLMLVSGTTLIGLFKTVGKPVKKTRETLKTAFDNYEEEREEKEERKTVLDEKPRRKIRFEHLENTPNNRSIDIQMGEGYHTPESDFLAKTEEVDREIAELKGEEYEEKKLEGSDTPALRVFKKTTKKAKEQIKDETEETIQQEESSNAKTQNSVEEKEEIIEDSQYKYPPLSLLKQIENKGNANGDANELQSTGELLVKTLRDFNIETKIINIVKGPAVTRFELEPSAGVRVKKIADLSDDIAMRLATSGVRIEAPIPNKAAVGIEVPNKSANMVGLRELLEDKEIANSKSKLMVALGRDISGKTIKADLAAMPHLLIAGTTGSGKSVCTNSMILSVLFRAAPDEVKLILIDPKKVEFNSYNGIPHLLVPVVTDPRKAAGALGWAVVEMNRRYQEFSTHRVRDLMAYNEKALSDDNLEKMPQILIVIDEFADLMMTVSSEVEASVVRLAQMGRAAGIHLVIATQRPSVDVITGLIKSNIPSRLALTVASSIDSRTILDTSGAEELLGHGDMLFMPIGMSKPIRVQGCFVSDDEKNAVINFLTPEEKDGQSYDESIVEEMEKQAAATEKGKGNSNTSIDSDDDDETSDEMLPKAIESVVEAGEASVSQLQRRLRVGYARAGRLIDEMERKGIVGPHEGSKSRKVLLTKEQWLEMNMNSDEV